MWTPTHKTLMDVLGAARRLLDAREAQMVTADNWAMLTDAVVSCRGPAERQPRIDGFYVDDAGFLVRAVVPVSGKAYEHRCPKGAFEAVADAVETTMPPFVLDTLHLATGLPFSQVAVAFAFLKDRGVIVGTSRRNSRAATSSPFLDAMTEYHALRDKGPQDPAFGYPEVARG